MEQLSISILGKLIQFCRMKLDSVVLWKRGEILTITASPHSPRFLGCRSSSSCVLFADLLVLVSFLFFCFAGVSIFLVHQAAGSQWLETGAVEVDLHAFGYILETHALIRCLVHSCAEWWKGVKQSECVNVVDHVVFANGYSLEPTVESTLRKDVYVRKGLGKGARRG